MQEQAMQNKILQNFLILIWMLTAVLVIQGWEFPVEASQIKGTQILKAQEIKDFSLQYIRSQLSETGEDQKVIVDYTGMDVLLPEGQIEFNMRLNVTPDGARRIPFLMMINVDGIYRKGIWLSAQVKTKTPVVKSLNAMRPGHRITYADVVMESEYQGGGGNRIAQSLEEVIGYKVTRPIKANRPIQTTALVKAPLVKRGDRVMLVAKKGLMKITTPGIVQERGFKGKTIAVKNIESKKIVYGELINASMVEVKF